MMNHLLLVATIILSSIAYGQSTWYEIPTGTANKLNSIDFPSNNVGYIVGEDSTLLKTINGGQTWVQLGLNGISILGLDDNFTDVDFIDENIGFLVSGYSGIYRTSDGGQSWVSVSGQTSNMCFPNVLFPFSGTEFIVGGAGCFEGAIIDRYDNGTWTNANLAINFWNSQITVEEMSFVNPNIGLAATRSEYLLRTIDAGLNWDTISTGITGELTSVVMVNDMLCYAGYHEMGSNILGILKSVDGGLTWALDNAPSAFGTLAYLSVHAAQNGDIYSGAVSTIYPGLIYETTDLTNWMAASVDQPINHITSYGSDITFGVGDSGYLVVNTPISELGIDKVDLIEFTAFPNPVLNTLTIENPTTETMEIFIVDASGRFLKKKMAQPGQNTVNCSNLSNGMYFVKVKSGNRSGLQRIVKQ